VRGNHSWIVGAWASALLILLGLAASVPPAQAQVRHVIHISVDGLRGDLLRGMLDTQSYSFPNFVRLRTQGATTFNARCDHGSSLTVPNHTSIITGLPLVAATSAPAWQQHGYSNNYALTNDNLHQHGIPVRYKHSVFDRVHDRGLRTMLLAGKQKFDLFERSYNAQNGAPDLDGEDNGRAKIDFSLIKEADSSTLVSVLISQMDGNFPAYTFMHVFDPDSAGHFSGWGSLNWVLSVKHADSLIGLILSALELRPALKAVTTLVITADHGGGVPVNLHSDPAAIENYTIPLMLWGPGVPPGADAYSLFANRRNPGASRPENDAPLPPLRNGDTGNIALALLGLPPITDSLYRPEWAGGLQVTVRPEGEGVECTWPLLWAGWTLETSGSLHGESWVPATQQPVPAGLRWHHLEASALIPERYYRLRAPQ
jgi:hypothetical protein